ncbi:MAG: pilus assembly protein TadG-related protein, partial [Acidobacteria bacterium]|nr:pilus assembly protein TadG-related protein [Acidobacteriota bacterium]
MDFRKLIRSGFGSFGKRRCDERGIGVYMVAVLLVVLLGVGALSLDLGVLYVARSEAQRTADASALAAAKKIIESGYTSGLVTSDVAEALARLEAITVGAQNTVAGQTAQILDADVTFNFTEQKNPRVTVLVQRITARSNAVPTSFARILGVNEVDVSATATAEAFNPSGGAVPIGTDCVKPWILPNCDPVNPGLASPFCLGGEAPFVDNTTGDIINPGTVIGTLLTLKTGDPNEAAAASQFYPIQIPPGSEPELCPECSGPETGSDGPGAALYRHNIECCNTNVLVCGQTVDIDLSTGNMVGPTWLGVKCLIHQQNNGQGQDILNISTTPFQIFGGTSNPNPLLIGQVISSSDSIITIPLYDGHELCPGGSC